MNGLRTRVFPCIASLLAAVLVAVVTGGCTASGIELGTNPDAAPQQRVGSPPDPAALRLAAAAERAEAALTALARIRAADSPRRVSNVPAEVPASLQRRVTADWIGPVETLAEALAERAGYRFVMGGAAPARPVMVSVSARDGRLIEVLRDAGLQAGNAATIVVNANERTVRLDWPGKRPASVRGKEGS